MVRTAALALALMATPSYAASVDGNSLYAQCTSTGYIELTACNQYIIGVIDGISITSPTGKAPFDLPANAKGEQVKDVVLKFMRENPDKRHWPGPVVVWNAMMEAFPNPKYRMPSTQ